MAGDPLIYAATLRGAWRPGYPSDKAPALVPGAVASQHVDVSRTHKENGHVPEPPRFVAFPSSGRYSMQIFTIGGDMAIKYMWWSISLRAKRLPSVRKA